MAGPFFQVCDEITSLRDILTLLFFQMEWEKRRRYLCPPSSWVVNIRQFHGRYERD